MSEDCSVLVRKDRDAVLIRCVPVHQSSMFVSLMGILTSLSGQLLSGLMILLFIGLRGAPMSMGGVIVQFGGLLMILEMGTVVITFGHL